ncbi:MAG: hypothetical protein GC129_02870 [Proteobacteria bacterium]|nr:hypothetical protein [Pseudomonadota bacterium]
MTEAKDTAQAGATEAAVIKAVDVSTTDGFYIWFVKGVELAAIEAELAKGKNRVRFKSEKGDGVEEVYPDDYVIHVGADGVKKSFIIKANPGEGQGEDEAGVPMVLEALADGVPDEAIDAEKLAAAMEELEAELRAAEAPAQPAADTGA